MADDNYMADPRAKTVAGFVAGLEIFAKYWPKNMNQLYFMGAEHDVLYVYDSGDVEENSDDGKALDALGFHYDEDLDGWAYFT